MNGDGQLRVFPAPVLRTLHVRFAQQNARVHTHKLGHIVDQERARVANRLPANQIAPKDAQQHEIGAHKVQQVVRRGLRAVVRVKGVERGANVRAQRAQTQHSWLSATPIGYQL